MATSNEDIANLALDLLTEAPLTLLTDNEKPARLLNRHFVTTRRAELAKRSWVFAILSEEVTGTDLATATGTLNWRYAIPATGRYASGTNVESLITNGNFDTDTIWDKGTGWTIAAGKGTKAAGVESDLEQVVTGYEDKIGYEVEFTISGYTAGTITPGFQSNSVFVLAAGTARSANGTYIETIVFPNGANRFSFRADSAFVGSVDTVAVRPLTKTLRVLPLTYDGEPHGVPISWRQESGYILSDQISPRIIRVITDVPDPDDWPPLFVDVMVAALAAKIAHPLTGKESMLERATKAYDRAVSEAAQNNALERSGRLDSRSWASARGDTRGSWR